MKALLFYILLICFFFSVSLEFRVNQENTRPTFNYSEGCLSP